MVKSVSGSWDQAEASGRGLEGHGRLPGQGHGERDRAHSYYSIEWCTIKLTLYSVKKCVIDTI